MSPYLAKIRAAIGSELLLIPGVTVFPGTKNIAYFSFATKLKALGDSLVEQLNPTKRQKLPHGAKP